MRVLVTGGAGFAGSHVVEHYASRGHHVTVLDNVSRSHAQTPTERADAGVHPIWSHLESLNNVALVKGSVLDSDKVSKLIQDADAIIHMAAKPAPPGIFEVNVQGTINVLEAARQSPSNPAIVYASSSKVYGEHVNRFAVAEKQSRYVYASSADAHGVGLDLPLDRCLRGPYGTSKLGGDLAVQEYAHTYGLKAGIFRMSSVYGPRQFGGDGLSWIANFVFSALKGAPIKIFGNGKQVRDPLYVTDMVEAYDAFLRSNLPHGVWNLGGGPANAISILELLDLIEAKTSKRSPVTFEDWRPGDIKVYLTDIRPLKRDLQWSPRVPVEQGISQFITWARKEVN